MNFFFGTGQRVFLYFRSTRRVRIKYIMIYEMKARACSKLVNYCLFPFPPELIESYSVTSFVRMLLKKVTGMSKMKEYFKFSKKSAT